MEFIVLTFEFTENFGKGRVFVDLEGKANVVIQDLDNPEIELALQINNSDDFHKFLEKWECRKFEIQQKSN